MGSEITREWVKGIARWGSMGVSVNEWGSIYEIEIWVKMFMKVRSSLNVFGVCFKRKFGGSTVVLFSNLPKLVLISQSLDVNYDDGGVVMMKNDNEV